ncbi:MAG: transcription antitermination factor NusB [Gammaproteobacteria bacterium]
MNPAAHKKQKLSHHGRSRARRLAVQALYQWGMTGQEMSEIDAEFCKVRDLQGADLEYFRELLLQVAANIQELDGILRPVLDRKLEEVDPVEKAILRIGVYELNYRADIPYRVIVNEAIILAKKFGAEQAHTFINGVLDKVAGSLRPEDKKSD